MKLTSPVAVLVLLLVAGCGGGNESFTEDYNRAVRPLAALQGNLGTAPAEFARLARRTEQTRANLARLDAPDEAQDEMDKLLAGLEEVTGDLSDVATAARGKDPVEQRRAAERLVSSSERLQRAETALQRAVED
jgi:hypothetical protein